jgi:predicted metal-dependent hydrolase
VTGAETIQVGGLEIELRRKPIRTIRLHVEPSGHIWVSLPLRCPAARAAELAHSRLRWLERQLAAFERQRAQPTLWGNPLADAVPGPALDRLYRAEVEARTAGLARLWQAAVGEPAVAWRFRWMKTRWGSCSPATRTVTINVALAALPPECLEEVLVHELAHLKVMGHGPAFYRLMDRYLPTWRAGAALLKGVVPLRPATAQPHGATRPPAPPASRPASTRRPSP